MAKSSGTTRASSKGSPRGLGRVIANITMNGREFLESIGGANARDRFEVLLARLETDPSYEADALENIGEIASTLGASRAEVRQYISSSTRNIELNERIPYEQTNIDGLKNRVAESYGTTYDAAVRQIMNDRASDNSILTFRQTVRNIEERENMLEGYRREQRNARQRIRDFQQKYFK